MKTPSLAEALSFADNSFPQGPEKLAERLRIDVRYSALQGCDGWCLSVDETAIIHINSTYAKSRQRFTLAHELGHLLLGIPSGLTESFSDMFRSDSKEERKVNDIAAELLLPCRIVGKTVGKVPVDASALRRLAKNARVSELVAALRVANLAQQLGLENASVAFFKDDQFCWHWSETLTGIDATFAEYLLVEAKRHKPSPFRLPRESDNRIVVASLIENPAYDSATLFVQLLASEQGNSLSHDERRRELEQYLFDGDDAFRRSLQGCFGAFKPKVEGIKAEQAEAMFWERYANGLPGGANERLLSDKGREYVRLRLEEWCEE
jgi:hypothetical protein